MNMVPYSIFREKKWLSDFGGRRKAKKKTILIDVMGKKKSMKYSSNMNSKTHYQLSKFNPSTVFTSIAEA